MSHLPNIFNANIAQLLNKNMGQLVFPLTLKKVVATRDPSDSTKQIEVVTEHPGRGFVDDNALRFRSGTTTQFSEKSIAILGDSLPDNIIPEPGDLIFIENEDHTIAENGVVRDPAGALFECVVE